MKGKSGLARRWRTLLCAVIAVIAVIAASAGQASAEGTTVTGTSGAEVPLTIEPSSEPAVGTIDLAGPERVLVLDGMPKSMTLRRVTLGDLARATGCEADANAELRIYDDGSGGTLAGAEPIATSTTSQALGPELERISWIVDPTALSSGSRYVFMVRSAFGPCTNARIRTWAHNGSQVDGGTRACALLEDGSTRLWRVWHRAGEDESRACSPLEAISGLETGMPSGWTQVQAEGRSASVAATSENCARELGGVATPFSESSVVCQFPQFSSPSESAGRDGWYYGLPWRASGLVGDPRDVYARLEPDVAPSATTLAAQEITSARATLRATINPSSSPTEYQFEWGTTTSYGHTLPARAAEAGSDERDHVVSNPLEGLEPTTTYHYRVVAHHGTGTPVVGRDVTFTTTVPPPVDDTAPSIAGSVHAGERLTARTGAWSGAGPIAYRYQWRRCDATGEDCEDVVGARARKLQLTAGDIDATLRVRVTASNAGGPTSATSAASDVVVGFPPQLDALPQIAGVPLVGRTLEATGASFDGSEPFTFDYQWRRCDTSGHGCIDVEGATEATYVVTEADAGATLRILQRATNDAGSASATSDPTEVVGTPALVNDEAPTIDVQDGLFGDALVAGPGRWSGNGPIAYAYQWQRCDASGTACDIVADGASRSHPLDPLDVGHALRVIVTATGAAGSASAVSAPTAAYEAAAPTNAAAPRVVGAAVAGVQLNAESGSWTGMRRTSLTYQWKRCDAEGRACSAIEGATDNAYDLEAADIGATVRVSVTATNASGAASAESPATSVVAAHVALSADTPPTVSGEPYVGATLTAAHGSWEGTGSISYAYVWQRCDRFGEDCDEIAGASASTYALQPADLGAIVQVVVTAQDTVAERSVSAAASGPAMAADGPVDTSAPTLEGTAAEDDLLTVAHGEWSGRGSISYAYQWQACDASGCVDLAEANESAYTVTSEDINRTLRAAVTATDEDGSTTAVTAQTAPVVATTLVNWILPQISGRPQTSATLTAEPGLWSVAATYAYAWQRCDTGGEECSPLEGATEATYRPVEADAGATLRVVVTATNVGGSAEAISSPTPVIDAVAPVGEEAPTISGTTTQGETLTASEGGWSGAEYVDLQWQRCNAEGDPDSCVDLPGATGDALTLRAAHVDSTIRVVATAVNGAGSTEAASAVSEVVASSELTNTEPPSIAGTAEEAQTLTGDAGRWSGREPLDVQYRWRRCDARGSQCYAITGATEATFALTEVDAGSTLQFAVTASDASGARTMSATSDVVLHAPIVNTVAPVLQTTAVEGRQVWVTEDGTWTGYREGGTVTWQRCDAEGARCVDLSTGASEVWDVRPADVGSTLRAVLAYRNERGTVRAASNVTDVVTARPPTNLSTPSWLDAGRRFVEAGPGEWSGTAPIEYDYQWERCDAEGSSCTPIEGATATSYSWIEADVGGTIRLAVTASNAGGSDTAYATSDVIEAPAIEAPAPPTNTSAPTIAGPGFAGREATLFVGSWSSTRGTPRYAQQWRRCDATGESCADLEGETGESYDIVEADVGSTLRVVVTATNEDGSTRATSNAFEVRSGQAPVNQFRPSVWGTVATRSEVYAGQGYWLADGPLSYAYQWQRCNAEGRSCSAIEGATEARYEPVEADLGSTLRVVETVTNSHGSDNATSDASEEVVVVGPPRTTRAPSIGGAAEVGSTLTADAGEWTPAPDALSYEWLRCFPEGGGCEEVGSEPTYEVAPGDYDRRIKLRVRTELEASTLVGEAFAQTDVVTTHIPVNTELPEAVGTNEPGATLIVEPGTWAGDRATLSYQWQACDKTLSNCSDIDGATDDHYRVLAQDTGRRIRVVETAENGAGRGSATSGAGWEVVEASENYLPPVRVEGELVVGARLTAHVPESVPGLELAYLWQRCDASGNDCVDLEFERFATYRVQRADLGHTLRVQLSDFWTFWEDMVERSPASAVVTEATAPANTEPPSISGSTDLGEWLFAELGAWSGSEELEYDVQWLRCDAEGAACTEIDGATESAYQVEGADAEATLRARVTATNGGGSESADSDPTGVVEELPPLANVLPPSIAEWAFLGSGSSVVWDRGVWDGYPQLTDSWQRCDPLAEEPLATCTDIPGPGGIGVASGRYLPGYADVGYALRIEETATKGAERTTVYSDLSGSVAGGLAEDTLGGTYSGRVAAGETVTAQSHISGDPHLPTTTTYTFKRFGGEGVVVLQEGEDDSYTFTEADVGYETWVEMDVSLWRDDRAVVVDTRGSTAFLPMTEPAPTNDDAPTIGGELASGATLTAQPGDWHGGGGPLTYTYQWLGCDAEGGECTPIADATDATYVLNAADVGTTMRVEVVAHAGDGSGSARSAASELVADAEPLASVTVPEISGTPAEGETLTATEGTWGGSAPTHFDYQWQRCDRDHDSSCTEVAGAIAAQHQLTAEDVGSVVRVDVVASNGAGAALASSATTAPIEAAPAPTGPDPQITLLGPAMVGTTVLSYAGRWTGIDADELAYQWERCDAEGRSCTPIPEQTTTLHAVEADDVGSRLRLTITGVTSGGRSVTTSDLTPEIAAGGASAAGRMVYADGPLLEIADADGSDSEQVADCRVIFETIDNEECEFIHPRVSPTAMAIVVGVQRYDEGEPTGRPRILIMGFDGSDPAVLDARGEEPTWDPLGTGIVYAAPEDEGARRLYRVRADGLDAEAPIQLTHGDGEQLSPAFSPTGEAMAYVGVVGEEPAGLYVANGDGTDARRLDLGPTVHEVSAPEFSPDGTRIHFAATQPGSELQPGEAHTLFSVQRDGSGLERLSGRGNDYQSPAVAPDGHVVAIHSEYYFTDTGFGGFWTFTEPQMWRIGGDGSAPAPIAIGAGLVDLTFGPTAQAARADITCPNDGSQGVVFSTDPSAAAKTIIHGQYIAHCRTGLPYLGRMCIRKQSEHEPEYHNQVCEDYRRYVGFQLVQSELDLLCRPGTQRYRIGWFIKLEGFPEVNRRYESIPHAFNCNEAGAWRFMASNRLYKRLPASRVRSGRELGRALRAYGPYQDIPPGGLPPGNLTGGWAAHHIVPGGDVKKADAEEAQRVGYVCGVTPNEAVNGVWLRGYTLRRGTAAYDALPAEGRRRPYHPEIHTERYFTIVRAATEELATSANTCSIRNRAIVRVRLNALANGLALDQIPYRSSPRVLGDGD